MKPINIGDPILSGIYKDNKYIDIVGIVADEQGIYWRCEWTDGLSTVHEENHVRIMRDAYKELKKD